MNPPSRRSTISKFGVASLEWVPLAGLTAAALVLSWDQPAWMAMWSVAAAVFAGFKWATWQRAVTKSGIRPSTARSLAYLFLWPGMDARTFLRKDIIPPPPGSRDWILAFVKIAFGAGLLWGLARHAGNPLLAGWIGMVGTMFLLHFGAFDLLARFWQKQGVAATPLMKCPIASTSLRDFWSRRWNAAFQNLAHELMFRPLVKLLGAGGAILGTFLCSGLIHDLVITLPIRGCYGLPTLYFFIQGVAYLLERKYFNHWQGTWKGRAFGLLTVTLPIGLLFPPLFVEKVFLPFMRMAGALP